MYVPRDNNLWDNELGQVLLQRGGHGIVRLQRGVQTEGGQGNPLRKRGQVVRRCPLMLARDLIQVTLVQSGYSFYKQLLMLRTVTRFLYRSDTIYRVLL